MNELCCPECGTELPKFDDHFICACGELIFDSDVLDLAPPMKIINLYAKESFDSAAQSEAFSNTVTK